MFQTLQKTLRLLPNPENSEIVKRSGQWFLHFKYDGASSCEPLKTFLEGQFERVLKANDDVQEKAESLFKQSCVSAAAVMAAGKAWGQTPDWIAMPVAIFFVSAICSLIAKRTVPTPWFENPITLIDGYRLTGENVQSLVITACFARLAIACSEVVGWRSRWVGLALLLQIVGLISAIYQVFTMQPVPH
jgi:hypothetical protein